MRGLCGGRLFRLLSFIWAYGVRLTVELKFHFINQAYLYDAIGGRGEYAGGGGIYAPTGRRCGSGG